jgi:hypothetical protein
MPNPVRGPVHGLIYWLGGRFARCANAHLSDDEAVAKMGHPKLLWVGPGPPVLEAFEAGGHAVRAVYIPPFAEARRMGHPSFLGLVESGKVGHRLFGLVGSARVGHPAIRLTSPTLLIHTSLSCSISKVFR